MSLIEPWSAIHDSAKKMLLEYVSKHAEYKGEPIDFDALIREAREQLDKGGFDSSECEFPLSVFQGKGDIDESIDYHFNAAVRRFITTKDIYENDMRAALKHLSDYDQEEFVYKSGKLMIAEYSCAVQHIAACDLLKYLYKNLPQLKSRKMKKASQDKKDAERLVLISLVKEMLDKFRPTQGWQGVVSAEQKIYKEIRKLQERCNLPITSDENELYKEVSDIVELESSVLRVYKENAKNSNEDPAAFRRVRFPKWSPWSPCSEKKSRTKK